jgi:hypothetical protein
MKPKKMILMVIVTILFCAASSDLVLAASVDLELPIQSALDNIKASADGAGKMKISTLYNELINSQEQAKSLESKASEIHYKNDEALQQLLQQIKEIDAATLVSLEADLQKAKNFYRPYLNVSTPLTTFFGRKVKSITTAAQLARIDIQHKQSALTKARSNKAHTTTKVRATLAESDPLKVQVKAAKSNAGMLKTRMNAAGKSFKQAVAKGDTKSAIEWLTTLSSLSRQIAEQKQNMYTLEQRISDILIKTKAQLHA